MLVLTAGCLAPGLALAQSSGLHYYFPQPRSANPRSVTADVCIYGATPAGIAAAIEVSRLGERAVLVDMGSYLGGMTASGLGATDVADKSAVGGISREFYQRIGSYYARPEAWTKETRSQYAARYRTQRSVTPDPLASANDRPTFWTFEPHVAEMVFRGWLREAKVAFCPLEPLVKVNSSNGRISEIVSETGDRFQAAVFIDATYEGDLMAKAGVSYRVGREANSVYDETLDGVHSGQRHNFKLPVDPFVRPGDRASGLLPGVTSATPGPEGSADKLIQAYNFRMCLSQARDRLPFPKPPDYDPQRYELLARYIKAGIWQTLALFVYMPNLKSDQNTWGAFSTDNVGQNNGWPDGDYKSREAIFQDHVNYQQGLMYFLAHDPSLPSNVHRDVLAWGLPKDEFQDTGGWPHQLYVREARRMVSDYVVTEADCRGDRTAEDVVGLADYPMDSHACRRYALQENGVWQARNEGNVEKGYGAYPISYRAVVPRRGQCANLLVPVCLSATHIAYGSIRMEPCFMTLGQSAGAAAVLATRNNSSVQDVAYPTLRAQLLRDGQVLTRNRRNSSLVPKSRGHWLTIFGRRLSLRRSLILLVPILLIGFFLIKIRHRPPRK